MPSVTLVRPFSSIFSASQSAATFFGRRHRVAEDVRMARHQLVVHRPGHVGQREPPLLARQHGVEVDLEEKVAQLLGQVVDRLRGHVGFAGGDGLDGVERLVGLLEQVTGQRPVGLDPVPGAPRPQGVHQLVQPGHLGGHRCGQAGHPQGGEVVGLDCSDRDRTTPPP